MATYTNQKTGVVHWIYDRRGPRNWRVRTACGSNNESPVGPRWYWGGYRPSGISAEVTCRACRKTVSFLHPKGGGRD